VIDRNDGYSLRDVGKLLGLSRAVVVGLVDAGFVTPARGPRREYRFSFPDLVVMRAAQGLSAAKIPPARILRSLRKLRAQLPERMPLNGLRIEAVGDAVVVSEGERQWQPDDGQYVFQFQVAAPGSGGIAFFVAPPRAKTHDADAEFERALELESSDANAACEAYRRVLQHDASNCDAYVNLGRLLHERGKLREAESTYREGLDHCGAHATLLFNLAVLQEDLRQPQAAAQTYRTALEAQPDLADAHHNLARLCANLDLKQEALRHWSAFRRLTGAR
jgi:tetratricopeptide (TPR) repeat protein